MSHEEDLANDYISDEDKDLIRQVQKLEGDIVAGNNVESLLSNQVMKSFFTWLNTEVENSKNAVFNAKSEENTQELRIRGRTMIEVMNWFNIQIQYGKLASTKLEQDAAEMERINREFGIKTDE